MSDKCCTPGLYIYANKKCCAQNEWTIDYNDNFARVFVDSGDEPYSFLLIQPGGQNFITKVTGSCAELATINEQVLVLTVAKSGRYKVRFVAQGITRSFLTSTFTMYIGTSGTPQLALIGAMILNSDMATDVDIESGCVHLEAGTNYFFTVTSALETYILEFAETITDTMYIGPVRMYLMCCS